MSPEILLKRQYVERGQVLDQLRNKTRI